MVTQDTAVKTQMLTLREALEKLEEILQEAVAVSRGSVTPLKKVDLPEESSLSFILDYRIGQVKGLQILATDLLREMEELLSRLR